MIAGSDLTFWGLAPYTAAMNRSSTWDKLKNPLLWAAALILIINSLVIRAYGDVIRSTYLFIASPAVFYPLAFINIVVGLLIVLTLVLQLWFTRRRR